MARPSNVLMRRPARGFLLSLACGAVACGGSSTSPSASPVTTPAPSPAANTGSLNMVLRSQVTLETLGATGGSIMRMVAGQGARLVGFGLAIGLAGAIALGRFLSGQLFGITPTDPLSLVVALLVVGATAALSIWLPARRAVRVSPLTALRFE